MTTWKRPDSFHTIAEIARGMTLSLIVVVILTAIALFMGVSGYHWLGGLSWVDSLLNASMILGGMGPVDALHNNAAKVFASFYALFSGLFFIAVMALILAPITHMVMQKFHVDEADIAKDSH